MPADDFSEYRPCFQCKSAISKSELQGPVKTNHCYIDDACRARGEGAPTYARYGSNSVCETCDPDRDPDGWSLEVGYFHDRATADQRSAGANDYGMYFTSRSNGCQLLPDMPTPSTPSAGLTEANANPTVSTVTGIGTRTTSAISAVNSAAQGNQGAEIAWAWYHGESAKCAKDAGKDVCKHTPSELSDTIALDFDTSLYYGHSVARVKVQQALAILQSDLATPANRSIDDIKKDIVAHMLIPHYQGAIKAAHQMDEGTAIKDTDGAEHWKVIDAAVGSFAASDRAQLAAMFATDASGKMNFCTVQTLLLRNLPGSSNLQYGSKDCIKEFCKEIGTHARYDDEVQHVTAKDVGVLNASLQADGTAKDCSSAGALAMPPPSLAPLTTRSSSDLKTGIADLAAATDSFEVGAGSPSGWGAMIVEEATVSTGTKLVFKWSAGHNVVMTTADAWASCTLGDEGSECLATDTYSDAGDCENGPIATVAGGKYTFEAVVSNVGITISSAPCLATVRRRRSR